MNLRVFADGATAIRFIDASEDDETVACPALALLDLNLPKRNGLEILERLRGSTRWGTVPVVIISSSRSLTAVGEGPSASPDYFFNKPSDYDRFMELGGIVSRLMQKAA